MKYQPTGKAGFDRSVKDLADQLRVRVTTEPYTDATSGKPKDSTPASVDTKRIIAQRILDVYGDRPDIVKDALNRPELEIYVSTADSNDIGGKVTSGKRNLKLWGFDLPFKKNQDYIILIDKAAGSDLDDPKDGRDVIVHELTHIIDFTTRRELTQSDVVNKTFDKFQDAYHDALKKGGFKEAPKVGDQFWGQHDISPEIRNYAFRNIDEFVACTMELFAEAPDKLKQFSTELFNYYSDLTDRKAA